MDHIDQHLSTLAVDKKYSAALRAALGTAKRTLNRYYSMTDFSDTYRIAMGAYTASAVLYALPDTILVLHPQYKLEYFRHMKWEESWIKTAEGIVRDEYERSYASRETSADEANAEAPTDREKVCKIFAWPLICSALAPILCLSQRLASRHVHALDAQPSHRAVGRFSLGAVFTAHIRRRRRAAVRADGAAHPAGPA